MIVSEAYLELNPTRPRLLAVNYFHKKSSILVFDWILNTPLSITKESIEKDRDDRYVWLK